MKDVKDNERGSFRNNSRSSARAQIKGNYSGYADEMISVIRTIIKQELGNRGLGNNASSQLASAIVNKVNEDGTVDVYFPPNESSIFTRISNQTSFSLQVGDSVELMVKDGSFSNCWVCAKHGAKSNYNDLSSLIADGNNSLKLSLQDLYNIVTDNNQRINQSVGIVNNKVNANKTELEEKITTNTTNITTLQSQLTALTQRVSQLESQINS